MIDAVLIAFSGGGGEGRQGGEGINYFGTEGRRFDDDCERSSEDLRGRGDKYLEMELDVMGGMLDAISISLSLDRE